MLRLRMRGFLGFPRPREREICLTGSLVANERIGSFEDGLGRG